MDDKRLKQLNRHFSGTALNFYFGPTTITDVQNNLLVFLVNLAEAPLLTLNNI